MQQFARNISFDATKGEANRAKHGLALAEAMRLKWGWLLCRPDGRHDYRERRELGFGPLGDRVHGVVFVQRGLTLRVISLRRANAREVKEDDQALHEVRLHHPDT